MSEELLHQMKLANEARLDAHRLREALRPFAMLAPLVTGKDETPWCGQPPVIIRHSDIRRAGAALDGVEWAGSADDKALIKEASDRAIAITLKDQVTCALLGRLAAALSAHGDI